MESDGGSIMMGAVIFSMVINCTAAINLIRVPAIRGGLVVMMIESMMAFGGGGTTGEVATGREATGIFIRSAIGTQDELYGTSNPNHLPLLLDDPGVWLGYWMVKLSTGVLASSLECSVDPSPAYFQPFAYSVGNQGNPAGIFYSYYLI